VTTPWIEQPIHFLDFEGSIATGIVEYGLVTLQHGAVVETATRLCRPSGKLRVEDIEVHGLDDTMLADTQPLSDDFAQFMAWRETGPLAAHFAGTENSLLKSVWPYPRTAPDFTRPGRPANDWGPWIDTGSLYRQIYPQLESYKLAEVVAVCGLQGELDELAARYCPPDRCQYHAALYDALAGAVLLLYLAREPQIAAFSLMQLLALSTLDGGKRDALQQGSLFD